VASGSPFGVPAKRERGHFDLCACPRCMISFIAKGNLTWIEKVKNCFFPLTRPTRKRAGTTQLV
jgi:hypothetical protein